MKISHETRVRETYGEPIENFLIIEANIKHVQMLKILIQNHVIATGLAGKELFFTHPVGKTRVKIPLWMTNYSGFGDLLYEISSLEE